MSEKIFKERFCEIEKIKICTTTAELNFDTYTEPGTYEIYEDMGNGLNRIYFLTVDKSLSNKCTKQTRIYCGIVETRHSTTAGEWSAWLTDNPFYEEVSLYEIYPKTTVYFTEEGTPSAGYIRVNSKRTPDLNIKYKVFWDGVEYAFRCSDYNAAKDENNEVTKYVAAFITESECPFTLSMEVAADYTYTDIYITTTEANSNHTVEIFEDGSALVQIEEKFIPDMTKIGTVFNIDRSKNLLDITAMKRGYINAEGKIFNTYSYWYSDYIPVKYRDVISAQWRDGNTRKWSMDKDSPKGAFFTVAAYSIDKKIIEAESVNSLAIEGLLSSYEVKNSSVAFIRASISRNLLIGSSYGEYDVLANATGVVEHGDFGAAKSITLKSEHCNEEQTKTIEKNTTDIEENTANIKKNTENIKKNTEDIEKNDGVIKDHTKTIEKINDELSDVSAGFYVQKNYIDIDAVKNGTINWINNTITSTNTDTYRYFDNYIPVKLGDVISVQCEENNSDNRVWSKDDPFSNLTMIERIVTYDSNKNVISYANWTNARRFQTFTIEDSSVEFVRIGTTKNFINSCKNIDVVINADSIMPHLEFGEKRVVLKAETVCEHTETIEEHSKTIGEHSETIEEHSGRLSEIESELENLSETSSSVVMTPTIGCFSERMAELKSGEEILLGHCHVKNNTIFTFSARFNAEDFDKLYIGKYLKATSFPNGWRTHIVIDKDNITMSSMNKANSGLVTYSCAHMLELDNDIQVKIVGGNSKNLISVVVQSNGREFVLDGSEVKLNLQNYDDGMYWDTSFGQIKFAFEGPNESSVLTDVVARWTSENISSDIWMFGDSYFDLNKNRWPYYMVQDGYDQNCLISGYAGRTSDVAMLDLENLLAIAKPKYIVWCLGMNDIDESDKANAVWKENIDKLINYCEEYGIIPILATIPNTPGSSSYASRNNNFKNAFVRGSRYQYIDFAAAICPDPYDNVWYPSIDGDGLHTFEVGAKMLYQRVLTDFPQLVKHSNIEEALDAILAIQASYIGGDSE